VLKTAIIGGTGVYDPDFLEDVKEFVQDTRYGRVIGSTGKYEGIKVAFIPRHGVDHSVPPHMINYRANIMALKNMGVENILATAAVGSLHFDFKPGQYVLADQFLDFTRGRKHTFYEGGENGVVHCDMTEPYCTELRQALMKAGEERDIKLENGAVYVCTEGPRFETRAEISMFKQLGGHLVGMTGVPEVCLARELEMCYASVCVVTNFAAGISTGMLSHDEVVGMMAEKIQELRSLIMSSLKYIPEKKKCECTTVLSKAGAVK